MCAQVVLVFCRLASLASDRFPESGKRARRGDKVVESAFWNLLKDLCNPAPFHSSFLNAFYSGEKQKIVVRLCGRLATMTVGRGQGEAR